MKFEITPDSCVENFEESVSFIEENWFKIPILNGTTKSSLTNGSLVRISVMVQDVPSPVVYYSSCEILDITSGDKCIRSGKYRDCIDCKETENILHESKSSLSEQRGVYYCVSIPGWNNWAKEEFEKMEGTTTVGSKRTAFPDDNNGVSEAKQQRLENNQTNVIDESVNLNCPISTSNDFGCVIHVYDDSVDGSFKVTDAVEVVGFVSFNHSIVQDELKNMSARFVPRIHAVVARKIPRSIPVDVSADLKHLRSELHLLLTQLLMGDELAADYLICHLFSSVYLRPENTLALGKLALNIYNVPIEDDYPNKFYSVLEKLVSKSHYLPLSLPNLNSLDLIPSKDYDSNVLKCGLLQLCPRTHLFLDETQMQEGKLETKGVHNVRALNTLTNSQKVDYDFKYYPVEIQTDIPVLIFSDGKSFLQSDSVVRLRPNCLTSVGECIEAVTMYMNHNNLIKSLRSYLSSAPYADFTVPDDLLESIQNDFVSLLRAKVSQDDLHVHLGLARFYSLSLGETVLTRDTWKRVLEMEKQRKSRIAL